MAVAIGAAEELLGRLCDDLRRLREEAGGPSLRALAEEVGLGKSQLGAILNGKVGRLPDWRVVRGLVHSCYKYARDQGHGAGLSRRFGIDEYWRPRYSAVEHLFGEPVARAKPAQAKPRGLPPRVRHFVGRGPELAALDAAAGPVVITGQAGVGKTTLAVSWAHEAASRFPDGQLYVDLRGFDPSGAVMSPGEAVRGFLEALGVKPDQVPASPDAQIGLYRSLLAHMGVLVVLDNARDAEQVRPLLPSAPGCLAVVTSRSQLTGLVVSEGAQVLRLDLLSPAEAAELLAKRLGAERLRAQRQAAEGIVAACARLPLALSVVASRAALQPDLALDVLVKELREPLDAFHTGDGSTDLRAVFSWSYRTLSPTAAKALRLLGLAAGGDIVQDAAASLIGGRARRDLMELVDAGLLTERHPGRFAMHDLVRAYATELANDSDSAAERDEARRRLFDFYLHTSYRAANLIHPPFSDIKVSGDGAGRDLADAEAAYAWFDAEHPVLLAEIRHADRTGFGRHVWQLVWALSGYLDRRAIWQEWLEVQELALHAARRDDDLSGQAHAYRDLARICSRLARHDEAYGHLKNSLDQFTLLGDLDGLAQSHLNLGQVLERSERHREALEHSRKALDLFTESGNVAGQAYTFNAVGWQLALLGNYREAVAFCRRALDRLREVDDSQGVADTLDSLGFAHHHLGDFAAAVECYQRALGIFRADGDRFGEACSLENIANSFSALGATDRARDALREALTILDRLGHQNAQRIRERLGGNA